MELDDLKNTWNSATSKLEQQPKLTAKIIDQMTQEKYKSKITKIVYPEIIGVTICLISAIFIVVNYYKLDSTFLKIVGILSIMLLLSLSIISLLSLKELWIKKDMNKPYAETLKTLAIQKLQFWKLQRMNITLSYLLMVTVIILLSKLFKGIDLTHNTSFWTFSFSFGYIFLLFYSKWVSKYYKKTLKQTEELLQELHA